MGAARAIPGGQLESGTDIGKGQAERTHIGTFSDVERPSNADSVASSLCTAAWLLMGITGSSPGVLKLENGRLSFDAHGRGALTKGQLRQLEGMVSEPGLANRLSNGEVVRVFDASLAEVSRVTFPWFYFGGGMNLVVRAAHYRFSFIRPQNTLERGESESIEGIVAIPGARRNGKAWRAAFGR